MRPALEEQIEQHEIERAEHADHQALKHEKGDHIFTHARRDRFPRGRDTERHQECRQHDERKRHAVNAKLVGKPLPKPGFLLDKLEARVADVEAAPGD